LSVRGEGKTSNLFFMPFERLEAFSIIKIPDTKSAIFRTNNATTTIQRDNYGGNPICQPLPDMKTFTCFKVPDLKGIVLKPRDAVSTVW
jgi:hypothetical protein